MNALGGPTRSGARLERTVSRLAAFIVVAATLLALAPVASAEPEPLLFTDPSGDVTKDDAPFSGAGSGSTDVVLAVLRERGANLEFELGLRDLSELPELAKDLEFHAQYALSFRTPDDTNGYSMRALYGGLRYTTQPLGAWRFQIHDRDADTWTDAVGQQDGSRIAWTVPKVTLSVAHGANLTQWGVQAWNSYADDSQTNDGASTPLLYVIGQGAVDTTQLPPDDTPPGVTFGFVDPRGDVTRGDQPFAGTGAGAADTLSASVAEAGTKLVFRLELADVSELSSLLSEPGFHAQYALGFVTRPDHAGYEMRAMFGGQEYTNEPVGAWRFQIHDRDADVWPDATAVLEGSTIVWTVPRSDLGLSAGDTVSGWSVQNWISFASGAQILDWAGTQRTYEVGEPDQDATTSDTPPVEAFAVPGAFVLGAGLSVAGLAWGLRRFEATSPLSWKVLALAGGFSRVARDQMLDHRTRDQISEAVRTAPGVDAAQVRVTLEVPRSTFWYHVQRMEREGLLRVTRGNGSARLFPQSGPVLAGIDVGGFDDDLIQAVGRNPGGSSADYAQVLNRPASTVRHGLTRLEREGRLHGERANARDVRWGLPPT